MAGSLSYNHTIKSRTAFALLSSFSHNDSRWFINFISDLSIPDIFFVSSNVIVSLISFLAFLENICARRILVISLIPFTVIGCITHPFFPASQYCAIVFYKKMKCLSLNIRKYDIFANFHELFMRNTCFYTGAVSSDSCAK